MARKLKGLPYCPEHDRFECGLCSGCFEGSFEELLSNYESVTVDYENGKPTAVWVARVDEVGKTWMQVHEIGWIRWGERLWVRGQKKLPIGAFAHS